MIKEKKTIKKTVDCRGHHFEVKAIGGDTYIQGWANKYVVDRGNDIINKDAWNLVNYLKVPTILFNHDKDKPIGKAVDVRPTDQGLWIKAKISNSKDPEISKIRDLINEGMLNAFSVGFDSQDESADAEGVNEIKQAELYEVSVVTLPMNQDSVFDVTTKSLKSLSKDKAISKILLYKGAIEAESAHGKIVELVKSGVSRNDIIADICSTANVDQVTLQSVLSGNITPVPKNILSAFAKVLEMGIKKDKKLKTVTSAPPVPPSGADAESAAEDTAEGTEAADAGDAQQIEVIGITIPAKEATDSDAAMKVVTDAGYEPVSATQTDAGWYVLLADPSDFNDQTGSLDLGDGSVATVGIRKEGSVKAAKKPTPPPATDPKPNGLLPDGTPPAPPANPGEEDPKDPKAEAAKKDDASSVDPVKAKADYEAFQKDANNPTNPAAGVTDSAAWAQAVQACEAGAGEANYAFTLWLYLQNGGSKKSFVAAKTKDAPMSGGGDAEIPVDDNPYLAQSRQTNVLLGVLIQEIRSLGASLQGTAIKPAETGDVPQPKSQSEDDLEKQVVVNMKKYLSDLEAKLKKIGA